MMARDLQVWRGASEALAAARIEIKPGKEMGMNFLERRAFKRAQRHLGSSMQPDEELVEFDIATAETDSSGPVRVDLIASTKAVYAVGPRQQQRIPFALVRSVFWEPDNPSWRGRLFLTLHNGERFLVTIKGKPRGLGDFVKERVEQLVTHQEHVALQADGSGATFTYRLVAEDGSMGWLVSYDDGVQPDEPEVDAAARAYMKQALEGIEQ